MTDYFIGLDLGQTTNFTALAVLQHQSARPEPIYAVRHLKWFPLDTPYTAIISAVCLGVAARALAGKATLVVDQTGVGRPVVEMLVKAQPPARIVPVTITAGQAVSRAEDGWHVPRKHLVTALQVVLESRRLLVAQSLPGACALVRELQNFRVRITDAANEVFGALRETDHDDLMLAMALAC